MIFNIGIKATNPSLIFLHSYPQTLFEVKLKLLRKNERQQICAEKYRKHQRKISYKIQSLCEISIDIPKVHSKHDTQQCTQTFEKLFASQKQTNGRYLHLQCNYFLTLNLK